MFATWRRALVVAVGVAAVYIIGWAVGHYLRAAPPATNATTEVGTRDGIGAATNASMSDATAGGGQPSAVEPPRQDDLPGPPEAASGVAVSIVANAVTDGDGRRVTQLSDGTRLVVEDAMEGSVRALDDHGKILADSPRPTFMVRCAFGSTGYLTNLFGEWTAVATESGQVFALGGFMPRNASGQFGAFVYLPSAREFRRIQVVAVR